MKTIETIEVGIYRRRDTRTGKLLPKLWIHYTNAAGKTQLESTGGTSLIAARKLRAKRMEQAGRGEPGRTAEKLRVNDLFDAFLVHYELKKRTSLRTLRSHLKVLRPAFGHLQAIRCTTDYIEKWQRRCQASGTVQDSTINRRGNMLRAAFNLARKQGRLHVVPYVPRLSEQSTPGAYIAPADAKKLRVALPAHLQDVFAFALEYGIRKGQLARTRREYVDLEREVIAWPATEPKAKMPHTLPLTDTGLAIVERLMDHDTPWCPFLFHGPRCRPGAKPSKDYGCLGDFKRAWESAGKKAGVVLGRKRGGVVFHNTRNTAATDLRAGGMDEGDIMKIAGWKTAEVFRRYDLGNVDALRERMTQAKATMTSLRTRRSQRATRVAG
jgi:integrase